MIHDDNDFGFAIGLILAALAIGFTVMALT